MGVDSELLGPLQTGIAARRRHEVDSHVGESVRRGMIRYMYIIVDWSLAMDEDDYRPRRAEVVRQALRVRVACMCVCVCVCVCMCVCVCVCACAWLHICFPCLHSSFPCLFAIRSS